MNIDENSTPEEHENGAGMNRQMLLDWHLVVASLAIVALLNWSTSEHASPGSMLDSEVAPVATRMSDTALASLMLPRALKVLSTSATTR